MLWNPAPRVDPVTPDELTDAIINRPTPADEYFGAVMGQAFDQSLPGTVVSDFSMPHDDVMPDPNQKVGGRGPMRMVKSSEHVMSHEEWRESPYYREGIPFDDRMTRARANAKSEEYDETQYQNWLRENREMSASTVALAIAGGLAGSAPDPLNYMPVFGGALKAAAATRSAAILGRAGVGALDASLVTAAVYPSIINNRAQYGDDIGWGDALVDIALAGALGGLLGGGIGWRERLSSYKPSAVQEALRATDGMAKAFDAGQEINLRDWLTGTKQTLLQGSSLSPIPTKNPYTGDMLSRQVGESGGVGPATTFDPMGVGQQLTIPVLDKDGKLAIYPEDTLGFGNEIKRTTELAESRGQRVEQIKLKDGRNAVAEVVNITKVESYPTLEFAENAVKRVLPDEGRANLEIIPDGKTGRALVIEGLSREQADLFRLNPDLLDQVRPGWGMGPDLKLPEVQDGLQPYMDEFMNDKFTVLPGNKSTITPAERTQAQTTAITPTKNIQEVHKDLGLDGENGSIPEMDDVQRLIAMEAVPAQYLRMLEEADADVKKAKDIGKAIDQAMFCIKRGE